MGSELIVSGLNNLLPALTSGGAQAIANTAAPAIANAGAQGIMSLLGNAGKSATKALPVSGAADTIDLFRGQLLGSDDFYYNKPAARQGQFSNTVGNAYYMTPNEAKTEPWRAEGIKPIKITANNSDIITRDQLAQMTDFANNKMNDEKYMMDLWSNNPDEADLIESLSLGRLQDVSRITGRPFIQPDNGQGVELSETLFYPDTNPELTKLYKTQLKTNNAIMSPASGLSPAQEEFFKDSKVRDSLGNLIPMYHGTRSDFTVFGDGNILDTSNSHSSVGHWFTPNKAGAKNFADSIWYGDEEPKVMETYLNIKNPKIYETVDNSNAISLLKKELDELELASGRLSDTKLYSDNMYYASMVQRMINQGNKDTAVKWLAEKQGYDDKTAAKLVDEIAGIEELANKKKDLQNKISDLRYGDAYQQFKTDIYREDGQTAEDANVGGIGMALNDKESIKRYVDKLRAEGHDGIIIKGTNYDADVMGGVNDQYVVFDPEQIKNIDNLNPTDNPDIRYALDTYVAPSKTAGTDITRIGSANVAPTDPETLPASLRAAQEYLDEGRYIKDIEKFTGKSYPNLTNEDFLDYSLSFKEPEDRELYKRIIEDMVSDGTTTYDKYAASAARNERLMKIFRSKYPDVESKSLMNYLNNHRTQLSNGVIRDIDKELSDRLGIGRSNTFMRDNNVPHDAAGAYVPSETAISIKTDVPEENAVSTLGHERLHSFQTEAELKRYDKRVTSAYSELSNELDKYLKTPEEIAKRYKTDVEYWSDKNEQQSRMFQQYMENKGYTRGGFADNRAGEWGDEINPAFDKFFKKLRALSKKGIALPSLALLFGGAAAANKKEEK